MGTVSKNILETSMNQVLLILILSFSLFLTACGGDSGERIPIKSGKNAKGKTKHSIQSKEVIETDKKNKTTCFSLPKVISKIKNLNQADFRVYTSDLRLLNSKEISMSTISTSKNIQAQNTLVLNQVKSDNNSSYLVDYAKNIIKDVPSALAPFEIIKQDECSTVTAKFFKNDESKTYQIDKENYTDFFLILSHAESKEYYIFQLVGENRLDFISFKLQEIETKCKDKTENKTYLSRSTLTYEWGYRENKQIELSSVLLSTFKNLLKGSEGLPQDVENELSKTEPSDTNRIKIKNEDYIRMLNHVSRLTDSPKCD